MSSLEQLGRNKPQDLELEVDTPDSSGGDNDGAGGAGRRADDGSDGEPSREELWKEMMKLKKQLRGLRVAEAEVPGRAAAEAAMRSLALTWKSERAVELKPARRPIRRIHFGGNPVAVQLDTRSQQVRRQCAELPQQLVSRRPALPNRAYNNQRVTPQ